MKKKQLNAFDFRESIQRIIRVMMTLSFFLLAGPFSGTANVYSQTSKINLSLKKTALSVVIEKIQAQTDLTFFYSLEDIKGVMVSNVELKNASLEQALETCLKGTDLDYEITHKAIVLKKGLRKKPVESLSGGSPARQNQKKLITGSVVDSQGEPIPGTTVMVKGTTFGTITDKNGNFSITPPTGSKELTFSFIGYKTQDIAIGEQTSLKIILESASVGVEEVVVVGYGVQRKESVVGAISQVGNKSLMQSGTSNITNAIAGKLSGVLTMQQTGQPGSNDAEIIIRGLSSWNGSEPLVLVDGVERDFRDLDPDEINTISVLKDASATAVFGAKGANGVLIVTTKRGVQGKPKLGLSASYGVERATRIPDHIDSYTTMSAYNYALKNQARFSDLLSDEVLNEYKNPSSRLNSLQYPNVNWFDVMTKDFGPVENVNFNVTGGTDFVKYFCSLGYIHEGDLFKSYSDGYTDQSYSYDRLNFRTNLDFSLTKSTLLSFNVGGDYAVQNSPKNSPWRNLYQSSPARFPAYFPAWVLEEVPDLNYPDASGVRLASQLSEYTGNPYNQMFEGGFNQYTSSKLFTDLILDQKLDFITKGLSVKGKVALSTYYKIRSLYSDYSLPKYRIDYANIGTGINPWVREGETSEIYILPVVDLNVGGLEGGYYSDLYYELSTDYQRTFGKHAITALALFNRQQKNEGTDYAYLNEAWVARGTYSFDRRYLLEFNLGLTGSERFAPANRYGFFPSGAIGWVLSEEPFFKNAFQNIDKLKFRYSDGYVGSDEAPERWLYQSTYYKDSAGKIREEKIANTTTQWENAHKRDLGVELGLFKNAFTLSVDLFDEYRDKMLLTPRTVTFLVGNSFKSLNLGELKKHGIEVEAEYNKTTRTGLYYNIRGVLGYNENRIVYKDDLPYAPDYKKSAGKPLGAQLDGTILSGSGYFTTIDEIQNNPSPVPVNMLNVGDYKYVDYSADGLIDTEDQFPIEGNLYPPLTFSLSGGITYKNFEFSLLFHGNTGKWVDFNQIFETEFCKGSWRIHSSQLDYWTPVNTDATHATLHYFDTGDNPSLIWGGGEADKGYGLKIKDRYWRNADYIRLKEIYMGYTIKSKQLNKWSGIDNMVLYASANNVYTFTNLIEGDPERKDFQQGFYPQMMTVKLGLKLGF